MNKTIISLEEGREALRVDGDFNDDIIEPLIEAIPNYLYITTGRTWLDDDVPLAQTTAKFILQLWFDPQTQDSERLKRTIDGLLMSLKALGLNYKLEVYRSLFIGRTHGRSVEMLIWTLNTIYVSVVEV